MQPVTDKIFFSAFYEVINGNPNGDPDSDNRPRQNPVTGFGYTTDMCQKYKIRRFLESHHEGEPGMGIYIQHGTVLNNNDAKICQEMFNSKATESKGFTSAFNSKVAELEKKGKAEKDPIKAASIRMELSDMLRREYAKQFVDIRMFGTPLASWAGAKMPVQRIVGPVVIAGANSLHPIDVVRNTISRCCPTKLSDDKSNELGGKYIIPYGLYRVDGRIEPRLAAQTGLSEDDVQNLLEALEYMYEEDLSAARPFQTFRGLYVWRFSGKTIHPNKVYGSVKMTPHVDDPQKFGDFDVSVKELDIPGLTFSKVENFDD